LHGEQGPPSTSTQVIVWSSALTLLQQVHNMPVFEVPLDQSFLLKLGQPNEVIGYIPSISSGEIPISLEHFV
jgi:hypothetical protein